MKDLMLSTDAETGDLLYEEEAPEAPPPTVKGTKHFANLAETLSPETNDRLVEILTELVTYDEEGREEWAQIAAEAYELLGIGPESEPEDGSEGNDTSNSTLMLTALTRFQSKALAIMLPSGQDAVRAEPASDYEDVEDLKERDALKKDANAACKRVQKFYTEYLFEKIDGYEEDTDLILHESGMQGMGVRKIVTDRSRVTTPVMPIHVPLSDLIISYDARTFRCGRVTHRMDMPASELVRKIRTGQYRRVTGLRTEDFEVGPVIEAQDKIVGVTKSTPPHQDTHRVYEIHCDLILREDMHPLGIARPYIVSIHATSQEALQVVRNWSPDDPDEKRIEHFIGYPFSPGKTATTPLGLGHILSNITRALRDAQRRALEAAYVQNHPSGFKLATFKVRDDVTRITYGMFQDVDAPVDDIRKALMLHPFQGPSAGLMALAQALEANGKELGGLATIDFAELMKAGLAAGPAMAAYEESAVFQNAIHRRFYRAHATELRLVHERMKEVNGNRALLYGVNGVLRPGDLQKAKILPMMKPGQASKQKEILEAQAVQDAATANPDLLDRRAAILLFLRALGNPELDELVLPDPADNPPQPLDPVSEYVGILIGKPVRAGPQQNHQAHIDAHVAQMQGLQFSGLTVDQGDAAAASLAAHIAEHMGLQAMVAVSAQLGIPMDQFGEAMPPEMEIQIAPMVAQAIQAVEAERAATKQAPEEDKVAQIKAKGEVDAAITDRKGQQAKELEELKATHAKELQKLKDDAQMEREVADNEAAIEVAGMRNTKRSNASAGAPAGAGIGVGRGVVASAGSGETG